MEDPHKLSKVAECLYRNGHGTYFALLKVGGKQIKRSLKTEDAALARRRLAEFRTKAHVGGGKSSLRNRVRVLSERYARVADVRTS